MKKIVLTFILLNIALFSNAQTYRQLFDKLDLTFRPQPHSFYSQLVNSRVEINAGIMNAYLNMYEATKDIKYLNEFLISSKRTMDRRDDFLTSTTLISGGTEIGECPNDDNMNFTVNSCLPLLILHGRKAWSRMEFNSDCELQPYPHFKESGSIVFPMARFVLLIKDNPNLSSLHLPNEINSNFNNLNYGNITVTNMGQYADWLKQRVYETLNFHYFNDWDDWAGRFVTSYSNGKGYNMQCAIGRTLIIMNYIAYLENDMATVAAYTNVIEKIAAYLYDNIHAHIPVNPATVGNGLLWYTWRHMDGKTLIEDVSHANSDEEFAELYMDYFHPLSGYSRFDITDMQKFANGFAYRMVPNPLELTMNTYGTNCNCDQMCCFCDNTDNVNHKGSGCNGVGNNPPPENFYYQSCAYIFLTKYNEDIYQEISDFYMPGNNYENVANVQALYAYSMLAKYENVFNPIFVNRNTYADSHWAGCAAGDFDNDGIEEFATVRNKDGSVEIHHLDNSTPPYTCPNAYPAEWAGAAAGNIDNTAGDEIVAVNNNDNTIYAFKLISGSINQVASSTYRDMHKLDDLCVTISAGACNIYISFVKTVGK